MFDHNDRVYTTIQYYLSDENRLRLLIYAVSTFALIFLIIIVSYIIWTHPKKTDKSKFAVKANDDNEFCGGEGEQRLFSRLQQYIRTNAGDEIHREFFENIIRYDKENAGKAQIDCVLTTENQVYAFESKCWAGETYVSDERHLPTFLRGKIESYNNYYAYNVKSDCKGIVCVRDYAHKGNKNALKQAVRQATVLQKSLDKYGVSEVQAVLVFDNTRSIVNFCESGNDILSIPLGGGHILDIIKLSYLETYLNSKKSLCKSKIDYDSVNKDLKKRIKDNN